ncbi:hypothetical protein D7D52_23565 [Nocardia yunnanensis]|uniref:Uncharacterized protein n=1 Tax=Nocardia yunnanensis TaxID=2382165 RepID=A0A386ZFB5_9NOCA|nr:hypothetical protein [Nocardia yunnanensis]AYF76311.1 hypothetical protein D7D52_23565 [Nocardia yunnanensis]
MTGTRTIRHIHIEADPLRLDFQGTEEQVNSVAAELAGNAGLTVTVDDDVAPDLPILPCARLWR